MLYAGLILCELIQSMIRTVIGSVFLHRFLTMHNYGRAATIIFFTYLIGILSFDIFLTFNIFLAKGGISCSGTTDWQIYTLISVDTIQAVLLVTTAIVMHA